MITIGLKFWSWSTHNLFNACLAHKTKSLWTLNCASADVNAYGGEYLISLGSLSISFISHTMWLFKPKDDPTI